MITLEGRFDIRALDSALLWAINNQVNDLIVEGGGPLWVKRNGVTTAASNRNIKDDEISSLLQELYLASGPDHLTKGKYLKFPYEIMVNINEKRRFRVTATGVKSDMSDAGIELIFRPFPVIAPLPDELGIPREFVDCFDSNFGVVFISGPTGSGKSTTAASILTERVLHKAERILTVEDPIEFDFRNIPNRKANITQSEVPMHLETFEVSTENSLRRSPDIIYYSEVRSASVGQELLRVANTGHLVATTLHANSAEMTLPRFVDMFSFDQRPIITGDMIESVRGLLNQRLLRTPDHESRTAVSSYVAFTQSMRDRLYDEYASGQNFRLKYEVAKYIENYGLRYIDDLKAKFQDGCLSIDDYARAVREVGEPSDLKLIKLQLDGFRDQEFITDEEFKTWKASL